MTAPREAAPRRLYDPTALRILASVWARRASGALHLGPAGSPSLVLSFADGGLVRVEDEPMLGTALVQPDVRFVEGPADGSGHRKLVARRLGLAALQGAPLTWQPGRRAPSLTLLVPLDILEEMALYPDFRWRVGADGAVPTGAAAVAAQAHALQALGWAEVTIPEVTPARATSLPPRVASQPRQAAPARRRPPSRPEAHFEEEFLPGHLGPDEDSHPISLDGFVLHDEEEDELRAGVVAARALLRAGQWAEATLRLTALRDTRLDNPLVIALLARARLGDVAAASPEAIAEAERWAALARGLATGTAEVEEALMTFERARSQARGARPALVTQRHAG